MWNTVLIVDDELNTREGLEKFLEANDYDVFTAESGEKAIDIVSKENPEIILADLRMPGMDGISLIHKVKNMGSRAKIIMMTAYGTVENAVKAMKAGAYHYLPKPVNLDELDLIIKKAISRKNLEEENYELRKELKKDFDTKEIIGKSDKIKNLLQTAKKVAESDATVLIQGETGTGKELLARFIHDESKRRERPFIAVHCAALTETLLASELFGHERGAFTGATERKVGRFERAHKGTLFLDEISEINEETQVKLLRVLQDGEFERVGGVKPLKVDVRLICATNKNLSEEVKKGTFRKDLYYRINVILLDAPPLRERKSDIPLLAKHFVDEFSRINNRNIKEIEPQVLQILKNYTWPGNIRELRNVIERMVVLSKGNKLGIDNIPYDIKTSKTALFNEEKGNIRQMEKEMIKRALSEFQGNKSKAADSLGISRRTLYRKLEEYKLN